MYGLTRPGVDAFGLPPRWFEPEGSVPTAQVHLSTGPARLSITSTPTAAHVTVTARLPTMQLAWQDQPTAGVVLVVAGQATLKSWLRPTAAVVSVAAKLPVQRVTQRPTAATVAVTAKRPTHRIGLAAPLASIAVSAPLPALVAGDAPGAAAVTVSAGVATLAVRSASPAASILVTGGLPALVAAHHPSPAQIAVSAAAGGVASLLRPAPAIVWVRAGSAWETGATGRSGHLVVLNAQTLGVAEYSLPWREVVVFEGKVYGVDADGIVELTGTTDEGAPVLGFLETGKLNLAPGHTLNLARAYPLVANAGPLHLTLTADVQGVARTQTMLVPARPGTQEQERTVNLPRGPEAPAWQVRLGPPAGQGADWSVSGLAVLPTRVQRRR